MNFWLGWLSLIWLYKCIFINSISKFACLFKIDDYINNFFDFINWLKYWMKWWYNNLPIKNAKKSAIDYTS